MSRHNELSKPEFKHPTTNQWFPMYQLALPYSNRNGNSLSSSRLQSHRVPQNAMIRLPTLHKEVSLVRIYFAIQRSRPGNFPSLSPRTHSRLPRHGCFAVVYRRLHSLVAKMGGSLRTSTFHDRTSCLWRRLGRLGAYPSLGRARFQPMGGSKTAPALSTANHGGLIDHRRLALFPRFFDSGLIDALGVHSLRATNMAPRAAISFTTQSVIAPRASSRAGAAGRHREHGRHRRRGRRHGVPTAGRNATNHSRQ